MMKPGPIAQKLIRSLSKLRGQQVVDLGTFAAAKQTAEQLQATVASKEDLKDFHPAHAAWIYAQNQVSVLSEILSGLPEMARLAKLIGDAEEEYMPSGPPMSPLTGSYFFFWAIFDAAVGLAKETVGTCIVSAGAKLHLSPDFVRMVADMQASRMGLYVNEGADGDVFAFHELVTGEYTTCIVPSGYRGKPGEIWFARILPSPVPSHFAHGVMITTPYIIAAPGVADWECYLTRTLSKVKRRLHADPYSELMKYGLERNYWNEYVFEAYGSHIESAVFLHGLPDVDMSRPHSKANSAVWDAQA